MAQTTRWPFLVSLLLCAGAMAADPPQPFTSKKEFSAFMQGFHENPQPDRVEAAMRYVAITDLMTADNTDYALQAAFSCLFRRYPDRVDAWKKTIETLEPAARDYLRTSMEWDPSDMILQTPTQPKKNDMSWACYFVTGDIDYARDVIAAMKHLGERQDLMKFLTAGSAQWSLAAISKDDAKVRAALEMAAKGNDKAVAAAARDALTKPVGELRASMIEVMKAQKAAGVWQ